MAQIICRKHHRFFKDYLDLTDAQDNQTGSRHTCVGCAYAEGVKDALNENPMKDDLSMLPSSQAGPGRHKDAMQSYKRGYTYGEALNS